MSKLTGPASYPVFFMLHSNKHANEVGKVGLATISTVPWFLRFMGKEQHKTTRATSQETEKNHSKLLQT